MSDAEESPRLTVNVPPVVTWKNYITVGGHSVDATFDLTQVPPHLHGWAMVMVRQGSRHLKLSCGCDDKPEPEAAPVRSWKEKLQHGWRTVFRPKQDNEQEKENE